MEFDAAKNAANIAKHGVSFEEIEFLDDTTVVINRDNRKDYGEVRFVSYGMLCGRLHCLIWTIRNGEMRPISFRKANKREKAFYETQI